jgi:sigma-B regulation protein RsbU (phosphoserine phosphatase)
LAAGAAIGLALLSWFVMTGSLREIGVPVLAALLFLLPTLALEAAMRGPLDRLVDQARFPMDWGIFIGAKLVAAVGVAAIGGGSMMLLGLVTRWSDLYFICRMVVSAMVLLSCAIRLYTTTKSRLEDHNRVLEGQVEAGSRELQVTRQDFETAREIQEALMPKKLPQIRGCELAAGCQPARQVGGDYFDAIRLSESRVAIAMADVSGKGMAAALLMSNLQAIVRAFAPTGMAPRELCAKANQLIAGNVAPGKFITFFYAQLDLAAMRIDYCSAGHNPTLLYRRDGAYEWLGEGGPVLGVIPGAAYAAGSAQLRPGDRLILYTDGISEAMDPTGEEFGEERLLRLLNGPAEGAETLRARILATVTEFAHGNFHDDATLLVAALG